MFLLPEALAARGGEIAKGWAGSLTMGAGQFCTNPGIAVAVDGPALQDFVAATSTVLEPMGAQTLLTDGIAEAYRRGRRRMRGSVGVREGLTTTCDVRHAQPSLLPDPTRRRPAHAVPREGGFAPHRRGKGTR